MNRAVKYTEIRRPVYALFLGVILKQKSADSLVGYFPAVSRKLARGRQLIEPVFRSPTVHVDLFARIDAALNLCHLLLFVRHPFELLFGQVTEEVYLTHLRYQRVGTWRQHYFSA